MVRSHRKLAGGGFTSDSFWNNSSGNVIPAAATFSSRWVATMFQESAERLWIAVAAMPRQCSSSRYCSPGGPTESRAVPSAIVSLSFPSGGFANPSNAAIASCSLLKIRAGPIASVR